MSQARNLKLMSVVLAVVVLGTVSCATKKYVRQSVDQSVQPLQLDLKNVKGETANNASRIRDVDHNAEVGISNAQSSADQANKAATAAGDAAQQGISKANRAQETAENINNYKPAGETTVLFGFNKSTLTSADQQSLDALIQKVSSLKHYALEVQGYTDTTGPKAYNLGLSDRRANSVVRYLSLDGKIPLVKIHRLGYGEAAPAQPNNTLAGRKANRRVVVTVMVPQIPGQESGGMASSDAGTGDAGNQ